MERLQQNESDTLKMHLMIIGGSVSEVLFRVPIGVGRRCMAVVASSVTAKMLSLVFVLLTASWLF